MKKPGSVRGLEALGRERLSRHFFMRDFLYSEIGNFEGIPNIPDDPDLALLTGRRLAEDLLEPLVETFGPIAVRFCLPFSGGERVWGCEWPWLRFERKQSGGAYLGSARRRRALWCLRQPRDPLVCRPV
ncbi:hypothetical protein MASR1M32_26510 [Rhodobacter sp.]